MCSVFVQALNPGGQFRFLPFDRSSHAYRNSFLVHGLAWTAVPIGKASLEADESSHG